MHSISPELKHVELQEVIVQESVEPFSEQTQPKFSLIPSDLWEQSLTLFNTLPRPSKDNNLVSVEDVKKQWTLDHKEASRFEIDSITNMVEQEKKGTMMSLKGFALGCALFPENRSVLPQYCSVKEYIHTGFRGSSTLSILCESRQIRLTMLALWVLMFLVNWIFTIPFAIYLHWFWHSVLFTWKNEHLTASAIPFSIVAFVTLGVGGGLQFVPMLIVFCIFELIYVVLSTIYIGNVCRLFCVMSHDTVVPVPQYTVFTSHTITAWVFLILYSILLVVFIILGIVENDVHIAPISGILGYPKRMVAAGFILATVLTVASAAAVVGFWFTGRWIPDYGD
ncbi:hypothetical protein Pelo_12815 [Pelomyxa schiedti]|nr:hypothetical protein Pelo_12815 [Pelomyxa schiedti]